MFKGGEKGKVSSDSPDRLNRLVSGSLLEGNLKTDSSLRVDGEVRGNINCGGKLVLGPEGVILGDIKAYEAEIEGTIRGNCVVANTLTLRTSANIAGDISTGQIIIENGAEFNGACKMGGKPTKASKSAAAPVENDSDIVY